MTHAIFDVGKERTDRSVVLLGLAVCIGLVAALSGLPLAGPAATSVGCAMLLLFGLPHGTLDLELIKARSRVSFSGLVGLFALYIGCAGAMLAIWLIAPVMALAAFIVIAVVHFSEDWEGTGSRVLSHGLALALLAAPSFLHRGELTDIFVGLTNEASARAVTDGLTLLAPVAGVLGLVALSMLWTSGRRNQAVAGGVALIAMVALPPIVGFALYFCLFHSPRHLGHSLAAVPLPRGRAWLWVIAPLSLLAAAIALGIYGLQLRADVASRMIASSFMTLSILTVPHMLVPMIVARALRPETANGKSSGRRRRIVGLHA